jgi:hypothetical protein
VIGTSAIFSRRRLALMTISVGELHARATLVESIVQLAAESAQAAVHIMDRGAKPAPHQPRQHRVAEPAVRAGHGAGHHRAAAGRQSAALDQVVSFA